MKPCLFLVLSAVVVSVCSASQTRFEHGLEVIIDKLKHGDTDFPIKLPSLRPLILQPLTVKHLDYTMDLSETTVKGLENLKVENVQASEEDLTVHISFSVPGTIVATADQYHLVGSAMGIFNIDDRGKFKAKVDNLKAVAKLRFAQKGHNTVVADLDLDFSANAQVYLSGTNAFLNDLMNSILKGLLADRDSEIFVKTKEVVVDLLNQRLKGHTPAELIEIVENEG